MDRGIVYPGAIPQDTDILNGQKNAMVALSMLARAIFGSGTWVDGFSLGWSGSGLNVLLGPGQILTPGAVDSSAYGSLAADSTVVLKQGLSLVNQTFNVPAPTTPGQSIAYLLQAAVADVDAGSVVLAYYNASNPASPLSGPSNSGAAQNTVRQCKCNVTVKAGTAATTGTQVAPAADFGCTPLYVVTIPYGATSVTSGMISANFGLLTSAAALLAKIKTVDGPGSGLDADTLRGMSPDQLITNWRGCQVRVNPGQTLSLDLASQTVSFLGTDGVGTYGTFLKFQDTEGLFSSGFVIPAGVTKVRAKFYFNGLAATPPTSRSISVALWNPAGDSFGPVGTWQDGKPGSNSGGLFVQTPDLFVTAGQFFKFGYSTYGGSGSEAVDQAGYALIEVLG